MTPPRAPIAQSWETALAIGRHGEAVLDAVFGPDYLIVRATAAHQRQAIDRFLIHRQDGRRVLRVDYKCDEQAGRTGNLALEHVSVVRHGHRQAAGWIHATAADLIVVYVPALDCALVLEVAALREAWPDILAAFPSKRAGTACRRPYQTLVCCVPIAWLRATGLIVREVETINRQLRLPLEIGAPPRPSEGRR